MPTTLAGARTRVRLAWAALAALMVASLAVASRAGAGSPAADVAFGYLAVACLSAWAAALSWGDGVPPRAVLGRAPRDRRAWAWVGLAVPLLALGLTTMVGALYLLSWVAPGFVAGTVLGPDEPSLLAGRPLYLALDVAAATVLGPMAEEVLPTPAAPDSAQVVRLARAALARVFPRAGAAAAHFRVTALTRDSLGTTVLFTSCRRTPCVDGGASVRVRSDGGAQVLTIR
jgi:hypothetical protein